MQRITISVEEELAEAFDMLVADEGYQSRSEAMRDLVRRAVDARRLRSEGDELCVANLSYVYDHHTRDLAQRLTALQHDHHDMIVSSTHVHLDHDTCLESTILKGPARAVRSLGDRIQAERGVRFGAINVRKRPSSGQASARVQITYDSAEKESFRYMNRMAAACVYACVVKDFPAGAVPSLQR